MSITDDITGNASNLWANKKNIIIGAAVGVGLLLAMICICCIRHRLKKKKKKDAEKIKLKGAKPSKKLKRIQPNKIERKAMEELGTISFTLQYEKLSDMLTVNVLETENVPVRDLSGYAYAYVVVKVMPLHQHIDTEYKTKLVRAGFWPAFGDAFSFVIKKDELREQVLHLYQFEMNRWTKQDGIGQISLELKSVDLLKDKAGVVELKKKLRPYDPLLGLEIESGAIYLSMEYDSENWELKIEVRQADIIPLDEDKEKATTYVTITLMNKDEEKLEKRRTNVKRGTLQPSFDSEAIFTVPDNLLPETRLLLKLKSKKYFKPNSVTGKAIIFADNSDYYKQLLEKGYTEGWFAVYAKPKNQ